MRRPLPLLLLCTLLRIAPAIAADEEIPNLPPAPRVAALTHARVVAAAGKVREDATLVLRDGRIEALGAGIAIPPDARVWDLKGRTIYPGLIDPFTAVGLASPARSWEGDEPRGGGGRRGADEPEPRGATEGNPRVHPDVRAADLLQPDADTLRSWRKAGFTAVGSAPPQGIFRGSVAVLNLGDGGGRANVLAEAAGQVVAFDHGRFGDRSYPGSLMGAIAVVRQTLLDAARDRELRAFAAAHPGAAPRPEANRALAALAPVLDRRTPVLFASESLLDLPRAAAIRREFGLEAAALGSGEEYRHLDWVKEAGMPLILPVDFPSPPEVGKEGPALEVSTEALRHWRLAPENPGKVHAAGIELALTANGLDSPDGMAGRVREAIERGLPFEAALDALTRVPARILGVEGSLGTIEPGKVANLTVTDGDLFARKTRVVEVWIDGRRYEAADRKQEEDADPGKEVAAAADRKGRKGGKAPAGEEGETQAAAPAAIPWAPPPGPLASPAAVLVKGATIWTCGPQGVLERADLLARDGKIVAVGKDLAAPAGAREIDAAGRHLTPGIIDAHSHSAAAGNVNEGTRSVTAEVRVADILDPDDVEIERLLAGGVTAANVLHGSANAIGGQNAVIKMRPGASPSGLLLEGAVPGIKFALGENPKQSNWGGGELTRYPKSRMGVEEVIRQSFLAARDYRAEWDRYRSAPAGTLPPPRRDLQLEALAEVLAGTRQVHAHAYRQDEILALLRLADEFGVRIAAFQHVLEGYKVGRELAAHGAGASAFSDWWAYKFEVYDGIPYNGALMHRDGVIVSFNSDSDELARRLNLEAAKAVKYGGVPAAEALAFVTCNPAKQLGLEARIGSLEPGKDADFVLWSGDPLSTRSIAEQTWVDGRLRFDRSADLDRRAALEAERDALLAAARGAAKDGGGRKERPGGGKGPDAGPEEKEVVR